MASRGGKAGERVAGRVQDAPQAGLALVRVFL